MTQDQDPIAQVSPAVDDAVPPTHRRHAANKARGLRKPELKLTSMIDVVFLLLIFFVVTASFQIDEGSLLANLPGNSKIDPALLPPNPVRVDLSSSDDGRTYRLRADGVAVQGATELAVYMNNRVAVGQMASDDLVQIKPQGAVRWQHVVNVHNACVSQSLSRSRLLTSRLPEV